MAGKRGYLARGMLLLACLPACSGQVVAVKIEGQDANPHGYYVCEPSADGTSFDCKSGRAFHQYHRSLRIGSECSYGIADVYVETDAHGDVTRIQYVCAAAGTGGFPTD